jgi:hypothetical protein
MADTQGVSIHSLDQMFAASELSMPQREQVMILDDVGLCTDISLTSDEDCKIDRKRAISF